MVKYSDSSRALKHRVILKLQRRGRTDAQIAAAIGMKLSAVAAITKSTSPRR